MNTSLLGLSTGTLVRRVGSGRDVRDHPALLDLSLPAVPESIRRARLAAVAALSSLELEPAALRDIGLCVSEAVTNAVRHAYADDAGAVAISLARRQKGVIVYVRDSGSGFAGSSSRVDSGGFGLKIISSLADQYALVSVSGVGTEVVMTFGATVLSDS